MSAELFRACFRTISVDWVGNKHVNKVPIIKLDLSKESDQAIVWKLLDDNDIAFVHIGPPCGTFSRAREKALPKRMRQRGYKGPPPLRSLNHPEGLPDLEGINAVKVAKANVLTNFACEIAQYCLKKDIMFTIENPEHSIMWAMPEMNKILDRSDVRKYNFDACMWGSQRDMKTSFVTNCHHLHTLCKRCDKSHSNKSWTPKLIHGRWTFMTAEEAEYAEALCQHVATIVATVHGLKPFQGAPLRIKHKNKQSLFTLEQRARTARQPKGSRLTARVNEYQQVLHVHTFSEAEKHVIDGWVGESSK